MEGFGVTEYTLVFRRGGGHGAGRASRAWTVARPTLTRRPKARRSATSQVGGKTDEIFVVPICSTLALEQASYERFLDASGVLNDAVGLLAAVSLSDGDGVATARKEIQALVMAAEVQYIVEGMTA